MAIGPMEFNASIPRVQDYAQIVQNEDDKGAYQHLHATEVVRQETDNKANTVNRSDQATNDHNNFDASDKGSNEYHGDGGQKRRSDEHKDSGKVIVKGHHGSFDVRI